MFLLDALNSDISMFFYILGGLGIFLFGITYMGDGLKLLAGDKLKVLIDRYTNKPYKGIIVGIVVTILTQSSSATTSLTVSLITAGLMTLPQSVGVIMGASIGATVTSLLIGLNISSYALPIMGIGSFLLMFSNKDKYEHIGQALFGFGALFFGLTIMGTPLKELSSEPWFQTLMVELAESPVASVVVGTLLTFLIQSSGAFIGIVQTLYQQSSIPFNAAITLTIGSNLGTTITAVLASLGGSLAAKRSAAFHVMFKFIGAIAFLLLVIPFLGFVRLVSDGFNLRPAMQVAFAHGFYNIILTLLILPFSGLLLKSVGFIVKGKNIKSEKQEALLNRKLINQSTSLAIEHATTATQKMGKVVLKMLNYCYDYSLTHDTSLLKKIDDSESLVDLMETQIQEFVVDLLHEEVNEYENKRSKYILHATKELERMGDLTIDVTRAFKSFREHDVDFDEKAMLDYRRMLKATINVTEDCISLIGHRDEKLASRVIEKENTIDLLEAEARVRHNRRLTHHISNRHEQSRFIDLISDIESISDSASSIAKYVNGFGSKFKEEIDYDYLDSLLES